MLPSVYMLLVVFCGLPSTFPNRNKTQKGSRLCYLRYRSNSDLSYLTLV
jgi:hypothetical protein